MTQGDWVHGGLVKLSTRIWSPGVPGFSIGRVGLAGLGWGAGGDFLFQLALWSLGYAFRLGGGVTGDSGAREGGLWGGGGQYSSLLDPKHPSTDDTVSDPCCRGLGLAS